MVGVMKILVVDLDGTLYDCNTFHKYLIFRLKVSVRNYDLISLVVLGAIIFLRSIKLISHKRLKYLSMKMSNLSNKQIKEFVMSLERYKNIFPEFTDVTYDLKILATAAPDIYARSIASMNNFEFCLATSFEGDGYKSFRENKGLNKKESLQFLLKTYNRPSVDVFMTDHEDDIPVINLANHVVVVNPSKFLGSWLKQNFSNFEVRIS